MGVGILSIGSVGLLRFQSSQVSSVSNLETIREISAFQRKIARKMNCAKTLNYAYSAASAKLSCSAYANKNLIPKTEEGKEMVFGVGSSAWGVVGNCDGNELIFKVNKGPKRRKNFQNWSSTKYGKDLFMGTSEFCKEFFDPDTPLQYQVGGYYVEYVKGGCRHENFLSGGCSCEKSYKSNRTLDFYDKECATDFFDEDFKPECGAYQFSCFKFR